MNVEQRAALLLLVVGLSAALATLGVARRPSLRLPTVVGVVFVAVAAFALAVGWAMRW